MVPTRACKVFRLCGKGTYYKWKKIYDQEDVDGLGKKHPVAYNHPNKIKEEVIENVLFSPKQYQLGTWRLKGYLER